MSTRPNAKIAEYRAYLVRLFVLFDQAAGWTIHILLPDRFKAVIQIDGLIVFLDQHETIGKRIHLLILRLQYDIAGGIDQPPEAILLHRTEAFAKVSGVFPYHWETDGAIMADESPLAVNLDGAEPAGEACSLGVAKRDHGGSGFVDESPLVAKHHGGDAFVVAVGVVVLGLNCNLSIRTEEAPFSVNDYAGALILEATGCHVALRKCILPIRTNVMPLVSGANGTTVPEKITSFLKLGLQGFLSAAVDVSPPVS